MQLIYIISKHIVIFVNTMVAYHVGNLTRLLTRQRGAYTRLFS